MAEVNSEQCCPEFDKERFQDKTHVWKDKLFLVGEVFQIMHIPVNMGAVVKKMFAKIEQAGGVPQSKDFLMLCYDPSPWKSEIYMTIDKDMPGERVERLTGTFLSRVYDGPYNQVPNWIKDMEKYVSGKGKTVKRYYFHYAYCPKCMKKYGHNYCVAFAQVA